VGAKCGTGVTELWITPGCAGAANHVVKHDGMCTATPGNNQVTGSFRFTSNPPSNACTPTGGEPQGMAVPTGATTICCLPK
jgi:hypothetical protein